MRDRQAPQTWGVARTQPGAQPAEATDVAWQVDQLRVLVATLSALLATTGAPTAEPAAPPRPAPGRPRGGWAMLTSREQDVLRELRHGTPNKLIAHRLAISQSTVKVHIRNIMRKLRARNRTQLAVMAQAAG